MSNETISYDELETSYEAHLLTTNDNPYNPFTQFDEWYQYDTTMGYNTCALIARILDTHREKDSLDDHLKVNEIIDRIIELDPLNQYKIVKQIIKPKYIKTREEALKM